MSESRPLTGRRQSQLELARMGLEEFRQWHSIAANADSLPCFHNSRWLEHQEDPVRHIYDSVQRWVEKYPYPL